MLKNLPPIFSRVHAALMRRGRSEHDANDFVQEAWVRLACYEKDQAILKPEAFLMRTALNLSIDAHRASVSHGEEVLLEDVVLLDTAPSTEAVVLGRERAQRMSYCLSRLSDKSREIFLAHRIDGRTYKDIAEQHGLSISTVEKHIARATMQLTNWMEGW
ncbi:MAG: RNA polymerase sigma factor [Paucibacter sp.]|nr:RNA polymerase sigma factor [Roseateles sp.]